MPELQGQAVSRQVDPLTHFQLHLVGRLILSGTRHSLGMHEEWDQRHQCQEESRSHVRLLMHRRRMDKHKTQQEIPKTEEGDANRIFEAVLHSQLLLFGPIAIPSSTGLNLPQPPGILTVFAGLLSKRHVRTNQKRPW